MNQPKDPDELQSQIDELQSRLAYQEDMLATLNNVIAEQGQAMGQLHRYLQKNQQRLDEIAGHIEESSAAGTLQEKPPHY